MGIKLFIYFNKFIIQIGIKHKKNLNTTCNVFIKNYIKSWLWYSTIYRMLI